MECAAVWQSCRKLSVYDRNKHKTHMKNTEQNTEDLTPSWETAVKIYIMVLKNPKSSPEAIRSAEGEITRLARFVDSKAKK